MHSIEKILSSIKDNKYKDPSQTFTKDIYKRSLSIIDTYIEINGKGAKIDVDDRNKCFRVSLRIQDHYREKVLETKKSYISDLNYLSGVLQNLSYIQVDELLTNYSTKDSLSTEY